MATLTALIHSVIDGINKAINLAAPLASGDPIPDSSVYDSMLAGFPMIDQQAQEAYDLAAEDEELKEQAQVLIEASDRVSALYTMLCDIIPARDSRNYDFYTTSMVLPYFTYTLDALSEIVDELNADLIMLGAAPASVSLSDNVMFVRVATFVADSLLPYSAANKKVAGFRVFALQQLRKFSHREEAEPFEFSLAGTASMISCSLDWDTLEVTNKNTDGGNTWSLTISRNGDVYGSMDSGDLESIGGMRLNIDLPEEYRC